MRDPRSRCARQARGGHRRTRCGRTRHNAERDRPAAPRLFCFPGLSRHRRRPGPTGERSMSEPKLDRRQMLKLEAAAIAAAAGGMPVPSLAANLVTEREASELKWDKAACRFCGTGCSVMVATK